MRLMVILALALVAAHSASAQTRNPRVAPVAPAKAAPAPAPRQVQSLAAGGIGQGLQGFQPMRPFGTGIVGLPAAGDAAPVCRAACAKSHNLCSGSGGEDDCDTRWTQCVAACRTAK